MDESLNVCICRHTAHLQKLNSGEEKPLLACNGLLHLYFAGIGKGKIPTPSPLFLPHLN